MALHSYHERHGRLPPAVVYGEDGAPLLSWRVLILPFLEQGELYKEFRLDEPWDGPHNKKLLARMPSVFTPFDGSSPPRPGTTFYQVFVGQGAAFEGRQGLRFREDFPDGISNTVLIVEAGSAVPWTKPQDLPYGPDLPLPRLGGLFPGTFRAAFADGSVHTLPQDTKEVTLRAAVTRNGGDQFEADW
jgi:hypothetical protein